MVTINNYCLNKFSFLKKFFIVVFFAFSLCSVCTAQTDYIKTQIQNWHTLDGVPVYFVQTKELPMVDIGIAFDAGSSRDGELSGLANFTANMLDEGTKKLNAEDLATQIDNLGILFNAKVDRDTTTIRLRSLNTPSILSKAIALFNQMITSANFPDKSFNRVKMITLNELKAQQQSPEKVGQINLFKAIYPAFPYGSPVSGIQESINRLSINNLKTFQQKYYVKKNAVIAIVGDISLAQAKTLAEDLIKDLPLGQKAEKLTAPTLKNKTDLRVAFPTDQTTIFLGSLGTNRNDPDYVPLYVGNHILGGGLTSRLFKAVRVKGGFSYSIYSQFAPLRYNGPFYIYLLTKSTQANEAIQLTTQTLNQFLKDGPTLAEVEEAKKYITGNIPLNFANNDDILKFLIVIGFYELPVNYLNMFINKVNQVTATDIKNAFNRHVLSNELAQVIVGQK